MFSGDRRVTTGASSWSTSRRRAARRVRHSVACETNRRPPCSECPRATSGSCFASCVLRWTDRTRRPGLGWARPASWPPATASSGTPRLPHPTKQASSGSPRSPLASWGESRGPRPRGESAVELGVDPAVADLGAVGQGRVDRAVAVAGQVKCLVHQLGVGDEPLIPADDEANLDAGEGVRPVVLLLTLHLDIQRLVGLLELLEEQYRVDARACAKRAEDHLGGAHAGILAQHRRLVTDCAVTRARLDLELHLAPGPAGCRLLHLATNSRLARVTLSALRAGEIVLLHDKAGRRYRVTLAPGATYSTHAGTIAHDSLIGQLEGTVVATNVGRRLLALRPTFAEHVVERKRRAQPIYPKDLGAILVRADLSPGDVVVEAGTGTAALTLAALRAVGGSGRVVSYEVREDFHAAARAIVEEMLGAVPDNLELKLG